MCDITHSSMHCDSLRARELSTAPICTLQHTATRCNTTQHTATLWHMSSRQRPFAHCNTLQHTATRCNTTQHTATLWHMNSRQRPCAHCHIVCDMTHSHVWCTCVTWLIFTLKYTATRCNTKPWRMAEDWLCLRLRHSQSSTSRIDKIIGLFCRILSLL